ncbi:hypothetical protein [Bacillus daqingensis]
MERMMSFFSWTAAFAGMNVIWLFGNAPLLFGGFLYVHGYAGLPFFLMQVVLAGTFLTLPLTIALFRAAGRMMIEKETDGAGKWMIADSWSAAKRGMYMLPITAAWGLWIILYTETSSVTAGAALLVPLVFLLAFTVSFCMMEAQRVTGSTYQRAFLLTFGRPGLSASFAGTVLVAVYVSVNGYLFLALFFSASLTACVLYSLYEQLYRRFEKTGGIV